MPLKTRRSLLVVLAIALLSLAAALPTTRLPLLRAAGSALVVDDPMQPVDIIVVPQWTGLAGVIDAADLVRSGIASRVAILPGPPTSAAQELTRRNIPYRDATTESVGLLRSLGVENIEVIPHSASSTQDEGQLLPAWCKEQKFRSIAVMSSPDHSRRVRRVLHRAFRRQPTSVIIRSARFSLFSPNTWWQTRDGIRTGVVEMEKLFLDVALHPIS